MASAPLEAFIDELIRRAALKRYHPTAFIQMRKRYGTISAVSRLVESGEIQSGFLTLREIGLIEWSIESAVVKFSDEFSRQTRECAEFRLRLASDNWKDAN